MDTRFEWTFHQRRYRDGKHMKSCSTWLVNGETQVNTTVRYQYTSIRMVQIQKTDHTKCWTAGTLSRYYWEYKTVWPPWKIAWQFLKTKSNISLPYDPAILLLGIQLREMKAYIHTKNSTWIFIWIACSSQNLKTPPDAHLQVESQWNATSDKQACAIHTCYDIGISE